MSCPRITVAGVSLVTALGVLESCCDDYELGVRDLGGHMSFGADVALDLDFDWDMEIDFDFRWSSWSNIRWATDFNIDLDLRGMLAFETETDRDMDDDGVDEDVRVIALGSDPSEPEVVFVTWKGDKYSFDQGRCYLLWVEGRSVNLLSADCGQAEPALHCLMTRGDAGSLSCDACNAYGECTDCSKGESVSSCVKDGQSLPAQPSSTGGTGGAGGAAEGGSAGRLPSVDGGGTSGAGGQGEAGSTPHADTGGSPGSGGSPATGGSGSVSVEWSTCLEQVEGLTSDAQDCNLPDLDDAEVLCNERLSDVNICYLAVQATGLFGSPCSALEENLTCGGLFP